jgi:hypothetical protein
MRSNGVYKHQKAKGKTKLELVEKKLKPIKNYVKRQQKRSKARKECNVEYLLEYNNLTQIHIIQE